jgi:hypothetical protein
MQAYGFSLHHTTVFSAAHTDNWQLIDFEQVPFFGSLWLGEGKKTGRKHLVYRWSPHWTWSAP